MYANDTQIYPFFNPSSEEFTMNSVNADLNVLLNEFKKVDLVVNPQKSQVEKFTNPRIIIDEKLNFSKHVSNILQNLTQY